MFLTILAIVALVALLVAVGYLCYGSPIIYGVCFNGFHWMGEIIVLIFKLIGELFNSSR